MTREKLEVVLPWGQHGVIRRKESGLIAQNHRMQDAGRSTILHTMFYVSWSRDGIRWVFRAGGSVWTDHGITKLNLAVLGSNTARLFSLMRLTSTPTNHGIVPSVSPKYNMR